MLRTEDLERSLILLVFVLFEHKKKRIANHESLQQTLFYDSKLLTLDKYISIWDDLFRNPFE